MQQLLTPAMRTAPRAIMVILGGQPPIWSAWLDRGEMPDIHAELVRHDPARAARMRRLSQSATTSQPGPAAS